MTHSNESAENYLETILMLSQKLPVVRSVDIANELGYKKSSISIAMKNLKAKNQITVTDAGFIYLTDEGKKIAEMIYERHRFITAFLTSLGVDEKKYCEKGLINGGIYIINTLEPIFDRLSQRFSFETRVLQPQCLLGKLYGVVQNGYFIDIGIPEDYDKANAEFSDLLF